MRKFVRDLIQPETPDAAEASDRVDELKAEIETLKSKGRINEIKLDTLHRILHKIGIAYTKGKFGSQDVGSLLDEALTYVFKEREDCEYDNITPFKTASTAPVVAGRNRREELTMTKEGPMPIAGTMGG